MMVSCDLLESLDFNLMAVGRYWRISLFFFDLIICAVWRADEMWVWLKQFFHVSIIDFLSFIILCWGLACALYSV